MSLTSTSAHSEEPTVVVVDDDDGMRDALLALFDAAGFSSVGYASGAALLDVGLPSGRCCVVLDLDMPGMNGIEVQSALSGRGNPPVVFLSGAASDADKARALRAGASSFIAKPASGDCLLDAVEEALAGVAAG